MRALVQRVLSAQVSIDQEIQAQIGPGLLVFLGVTHRDTTADVEWLAGKVSRLRIFTDESDKMNLSVQDIGGEILVVSQFTLYGDCRRGNRPGFDQAALPSQAEPLYESFCQWLSGQGIPVRTGRFAAHMEIGLVNDGPVTIWLESPSDRKEGSDHA
jgi:D-aminoacyl-tRNA deacylase